jgi:hypothetical protein
MKHLRLVLILSALASSVVHAQRDSEPIPDFTNLDEFVYEPKTTLSFGARTLTGGKVSFSGQGQIAAPEPATNATDSNILRFYHDGVVAPDARFTLELNDDGTIKFDENDNPTTVPITPDGKTNQWQYNDSRQATEVPGFIAMHTYSADITDTRRRTKDGNGSMGVELAVARDMGKIFNSRFSWQLSAGVTINDVNVVATDTVQANLITITDLYSLHGETAPDAPYSAPAATVTTVVDADGEPILDVHGNPQLIVTDTAVLLGNAPVSRTTTVTSDDTSVTHRAKLRGAYYTFRAGPTLWMPISNRFRASISLGGLVIYAGTNYTLVQSFQPETGFEISETLEDNESRFLPGYYADATLQFDVTPRTGFYAGAVFQSAGDYNQKLNSTAGMNYSTKMEFGNQQGFRAGMTIKF